MAVFILTFSFSVIIASTNCEGTISTVVPQNKNLGVPTLNSRFFGLDGIINNLFPGFNQGNQGGPVRNPLGMDFPANSQFYPTAPIQQQNPLTPPGSGNSWPIIDDASQYPNRGNTQYPPQGNPGGYQQYPDPGNFGGVTQYPPYPPRGGMGGSFPGYQQYPGQGGQNNQYPGFAGGLPPSQMPPYPGQGGVINPQYPTYPGEGNQYPAGENQYPNNGQYPSQGGWNQNPDNFMPQPGQGDGTLDGLVPPQNPQGPWDSGMPNDFYPADTPPQESNPDDQGMGMDNPSDGNAILGRPVMVPPDTTNPGQITFPSSTESPARRQCVQDCQTTSEYNPVCGSDDITYINPGKFVCARNCGMNVFVRSRGRCRKDTPNPPNVLPTSRPMILQ